jgi:hypothetical protein
MIDWYLNSPNNTYRCRIGEFTLEVWQEAAPHNRWFVSWWLTAEGDFHKTLHGQLPLNTNNADWARVEGLTVFRNWFSEWSNEMLKSFPAQITEWVEEDSARKVEELNLEVSRLDKEVDRLESLLQMISFAAGDSKRVSDLCIEALSKIYHRSDKLD